MVRTSVVAPAHNEARHIGAFLNALAAQTRAPDEVIIVDDNSTDETVPLALGYAGKLPLRVLSAEGRGVVPARNQGVRAATGDVVLMTDVDITVPRDWVERIAARYDADPALVALTGDVLDRDGRPLETVASHLVNVLYDGMGGNTSYRKSAWEKAGGYVDDTATVPHDIALWMGLQGAGKVAHDGGITVLHDSGWKWTATGAAALGGLAALALLFYEAATRGDDG